MRQVCEALLRRPARSGILISVILVLLAVLIATILILTGVSPPSIIYEVFVDN